jgi:hypothetical protein
MALGICDSLKIITSEIPIFDIVPGWLVPIVLETWVNASATHISDTLALVKILRLFVPESHLLDFVWCGR